MTILRSIVFLSSDLDSVINNKYEPFGPIMPINIANSIVNSFALSLRTDKQHCPLLTKFVLTTALISAN